MPAAFRSVRRAVAAIVAALGASGAVAQGAPACNCADARDLYSRYCAASQAVGEWDRVARAVGDRERQQRRVIVASEIRDDLRQCLKEAIRFSELEGPGHRHASGQTDDDCKVSTQTANRCMDGAIQAHEAWHVRQCEAAKKPDAPWRAETTNPFRYLLAEHLSRFYVASAIDYINEERFGYLLEMTYLRNRLEELAATCNEPTVYRPTRQGRSYTLNACPRPDPKDYTNQQCVFPR